MIYLMIRMLYKMYLRHILYRVDSSAKLCGQPSLDRRSNICMNTVDDRHNQ